MSDTPAPDDLAAVLQGMQAFELTVHAEGTVTNPPDNQEEGDN